MEKELKIIGDEFKHDCGCISVSVENEQGEECPYFTHLCGRHPKGSAYKALLHPRVRQDDKE